MNESIAVALHDRLVGLAIESDLYRVDRNAVLQSFPRGFVYSIPRVTSVRSQLDLDLIAMRRQVMGLAAPTVWYWIRNAAVISARNGYQDQALEFARTADALHPQEVPLVGEVRTILAGAASAQEREHTAMLVSHTAAMLAWAERHGYRLTDDQGSEVGWRQLGFARYGAHLDTLLARLYNGPGAPPAPGPDAFDPYDLVRVRARAARVAVPPRHQVKVERVHNTWTLTYGGRVVARILLSRDGTVSVNLA